MNHRELHNIFWQKSKDFFQNLNLFSSIPPSNDEHELRNQRISTRLSIFLFILSLIILLLYNSLIGVTKIINIKAPTLAQYSQLYSTHSKTLTCTCTTILINYEKFLHVQYTLHQLCSSIFITNDWISYLSSNLGPYYDNDFRFTGIFAFQSLIMFCELINKTISDSLLEFYSNQYVSASLTSSELFQTQAEALINEFRSFTTSRFLLSLSTIRRTTQANGLFSGLLGNFKIYPEDNRDTVFFRPAVYNDCFCLLSAICIYPSSICQYPSRKILFTVPGFYTGCYIIESLLQSTLQCFYNQTCINQIQNYLQPSLLINVIALDSSLPSQYLENSTIQKLIDSLMIEKWNWTSMYDKYYDECHPTECTYIIETRNNIIYIITTLFGIVGGLITILKLFVPRLIKFIMYCIRKCRRRIVPDVTTIET